MTIRRLLPLGAALGLLLAAAAPASAHTELSGANPGSGDTVTSVERIRLEFTDELLDVGAEIQVVGSDGADYAEGDVGLGKRGVATVAVSPALPAGKVTVKWRVVAHDGHPVEGDYSFTYAPPEPSPSPSPSATAASPSAVAVASPVPLATPSAVAGAGDDAGAGALGWLAVGGGIALAAAGGGALVMMGRRRGPA